MGLKENTTAQMQTIIRLPLELKPGTIEYEKISSNFSSQYCIITRYIGDEEKPALLQLDTKECACWYHRHLYWR
jgi:hypothetical protein